MLPSSKQIEKLPRKLPQKLPKKYPQMIRKLLNCLPGRWWARDVGRCGRARQQRVAAAAAVPVDLAGLAGRGREALPRHEADTLNLNVVNR